MRLAARTLGLQFHIVNATTEPDIDNAFGILAERQVGGLVVPSDVFLITKMSYSGNAFDVYRQAGSYAGRVLKGEKPADLPVQQTTAVELTINLRSAKALGLILPLSLLGRADEVIE